MSGNLYVDGKLNLTNASGAGYITSGEDKTGIPGRLHISNGEDLYLLPKGTTHISSAWGGTGNLDVSGQSSCNTLCIGNTCIDETHLGMLLRLVNGDGISIYDTDGGNNYRKTSLSRNLPNDRFDYASYYKTPKK